MTRAAAFLSLLGCSVCRDTIAPQNYKTGERQYLLRCDDGNLYIITPRILSQYAKQFLQWLDYPYGDPGEPAEKDEKGKVVREARNPVRGYVNPNFRDALDLPESELTVDGISFALPQVACNNLTWQQYRSLQALVPQLLADGITDETAIEIQAQFLAHILVPARPTASSSDRFSPQNTFRYDAERAEQTVPFWEGKLKNDSMRSHNVQSPMFNVQCLFHLCFQCYQTAVQYYSQVYPLLFGGSGGSRDLEDALTGETGTLNSIMKYQGYTSPQEVYDTNLPIILSTLNTMTKEAKEIERMNAKIKKK